VFFLSRSKDLSLHASPNNPEGIGNDIAYKAAYTCTYGVKLKRVILPTILLLESYLGPLIQREIYRVKEWNAKHRY
jgi:hypothetical protein